LALARTIVHEASHAFAAIPGDKVEDGHATFEVYAHSDSYKQQCADVAIDCADSYAWAALSIFKGHVALPWTSDDPGSGFHNEGGCLDCL